MGRVIAGAEKVLAALSKIVFTRESERARAVIIIESISAESAPRVSSRDCSNCVGNVFTSLNSPVSSLNRNFADAHELRQSILSPAPRMQIRRNERWIYGWMRNCFVPTCARAVANYHERQQQLLSRQNRVYVCASKLMQIRCRRLNACVRQIHDWGTS